MFPLHDYQQACVDFAVERLIGGGGAGLFLDPGLGKTRSTLEVIEILSGIDGVRRVLLTGPLRVLENVWRQEADKFGKDFQFTKYGKRVLDDGRVRIDLISRDSLHRVTPAEARRYDAFILDESSSFKSWKSKRSKAARALSKLIPRRLILTGTPMPNSVRDLGPQAYIMDGTGETLGKTEAYFNRTYCMKGGYMGREWRPMYGADKRINEALTPFVIRFDAESNIKMPELVKNPILVTLPAAVQREAKRLKKELVAELEAASITAMNAAGSYMKLRQLASGAILDDYGVPHKVHDEKVKALDDLDSELGGKPLLIFYNFTAELELLIRPKFPECSVLNGATKDGEEQIDNWLSGKTRVIAIQTSAGSHGLNLQGGGCRDVVFFSLGDSAEAFDQAYRRVYRQGATGTVRIHFLRAKDSVEQVIADRVDGKLRGQSEFLAALKSWAKT